MDETIKTVLLSAPLNAVLASFAIWLFRSWITERLANAIRHKYDKDLEAHKATIKAQFDAELEVRKAALKAQSDAELEVHKANVQRWFHIDKSQFDMEFTSFQKLWSSQCALVDATTRLVNVYLNAGWANEDHELRKLAESADQAFFVAYRVNQELKPFMPADIHRKSESLAADCKKEITFFFTGFSHELPADTDEDAARRETKKNKNAIVHNWEVLSASIRNRLLCLSSASVRACRTMPNQDRECDSLQMNHGERP